jgi:rhodanese-related sulfurtransferase
MDTTRNAEAQIASSELLAAIEAGRAPTILDVRSRWEFARGHVPGAIHMPFWTVWLRASEIAGPSDTPIVLYCGHGPRARLARVALRLRGFSRIVYLTGHMSTWKRAGLPIGR